MPDRRDAGRGSDDDHLLVRALQDFGSLGVFLDLSESSHEGPLIVRREELLWKQEHEPIQQVPDVYLD